MKNSYYLFISQGLCYPTAFLFSENDTIESTIHDMVLKAKVALNKYPTTTTTTTPKLTW